MKGTRLQVILARAGVASRRACEKLITDGEVEVNGRTVTELGTRVEEDDRISVHGKALRAAQPHRYLMLNKPREVVTTASDPEGRRTVMDFVPGLRERVWPVGRLDYHSEGLVILTNDGDLTQALTHPSRHVPRVYHAKIDGELSPEAREQLRKGVRLEGHLTGPVETRPLRNAAHSKEHSWIEVVVHEGRYHLVREALLRVGHPVSRLKRVAFGPLKIGRSPAGSVRELLASEVDDLKRATRLARTAERAAPPAPRPPRSRPRKGIGLGPSRTPAPAPAAASTTPAVRPSTSRSRPAGDRASATGRPSAPGRAASSRHGSPSRPGSSGRPSSSSRPASSGRSSSGRPSAPGRPSSSGRPSAGRPAPGRGPSKPPGRGPKRPSR